MFSFFFFSSRRRHTRLTCDWSSDVCSSDLEAYAVGHGSLGQAPGINHSTLKAKGFDDEAIAKVEKALPTAFDIKFAFNKWTLGEDLLREKLGVRSEERRVGKECRSRGGRDE